MSVNDVVNSFYTYTRMKSSRCRLTTTCVFFSLVFIGFGYIGILFWFTESVLLGSGIVQSPPSDELLKYLMTSWELSATKSIQNLYSVSYNMLHFYHLPKRKRSTEFTEITSANRDSANPLAPDFTVHVDYGLDSVLIYEDYGSGCVYRIYLFPSLPTETRVLHSLTSRDLRSKSLLLVIDGHRFSYSLEAILEGNESPFYYPMTTRHARPASGLGTYVPICYRHNMTITYQHDEPFPNGLLNITQRCSALDQPCPVHIYSAVSRHKYTFKTDVTPFYDIAGNENTQYKQRLLAYSTALQSPELHGPDKFDDCNLQCVPIQNGQTRELLLDQQPGVVTSLKIRVYNVDRLGDYVLSSNWNNLLLTAHFDGHSSPQIDAVPLGWLYGVTASLNDHMSSVSGHRLRSCKAQSTHTLPLEDITGYFYLPMPYWMNANITVTASRFLPQQTVICSQLTRVANHYDVMSTGHLRTQQHYYTDDVSGWRVMLEADDMWGHVVGVLLNVDNLRARRNAPLSERWSMLQSDHVLYIDGRREAAMIGTGLEDYFSYAHGFALAENTTYAYVGNYHAAPRRKEPLTWHCYRHHVLDPIVFNDNVLFIMEGNDRFEHFGRLRSISYNTYMKRLINEQTTQAYLVLYYAQATSPEARTSSALAASFHMIDYKLKPSNECPDENTTFAKLFHHRQLQYFGHVISNRTESVIGRRFQPGDNIQFTLAMQSRVSDSCVALRQKYAEFLTRAATHDGSSGGLPTLKTRSVVVLRRRFYQPPHVWSQKAKLWINGRFYGYWFVPMGTFNAQYSLRESDVMLHANDVDVLQRTKQVTVMLEPETEWFDIEYELIVYR